MRPFVDTEQYISYGSSEIVRSLGDEDRCGRGSRGRNSKTQKERSSARRVTFSKTGSAVKVRHINDYRPSEKRRCWYTPAESRAIRSNVMDSIAALRHIIDSKSATSEAQDGIVRRGIECRMREVVRSRQDLKRRATLAVLDEQRSQWEQGTSDPERIAMMYGHHCASSQEEARRRAARDAREVVAMAA